MTVEHTFALYISSVQRGSTVLASIRLALLVPKVALVVVPTKISGYTLQ